MLKICSAALVALSVVVLGVATPASAVVFDITLTGPAEFIPGVPLPGPFSGVLSVGGMGIPAQRVELQLDGAPQAVDTTDQSGAFSITLPPIGNTLDHTVTAIVLESTPLEASETVPLMVKRFPLTVSVVGSGDGTVTSPAGISCPPTCTVQIPATTSVNLNAIPAGGSMFTGWSGACGGPGSCTVAMHQPHSVVARFDTPAHIIVSPPFWNIPDVGYNQNIQQTFIVTNTGGSPAGTLSVNLTNNDGSFSFAGNSCSGVPLAPQQSCQATVNFHQNSLFGFSNSGNLAISALPGGNYNIQMTGG